MHHPPASLLIITFMTAMRASTDGPTSARGRRTPQGRRTRPQSGPACALRRATCTDGASGEHDGSPVASITRRIGRWRYSSSAGVSATARAATATRDRGGGAGIGAEGGVAGCRRRRWRERRRRRRGRRGRQRQRRRLGWRAQSAGGGERSGRAASTSATRSKSRNELDVTAEKWASA
jgi:hypothetical protein